MTKECCRAKSAYDAMGDHPKCEDCPNQLKAEARQIESTTDLDKARELVDFICEDGLGEEDVDILRSLIADVEKIRADERERCLQIIADMPTPENEYIMEGEERAYRAIEALKPPAPEAE